MGCESLTETHLVMQMSPQFPPNLVKKLDNLKGSPFEESALPVGLRRYAEKRTCMGGFLKTNQMMGNYVGNGLDKRKSQLPRYTP